MLHLLSLLTAIISLQTFATAITLPNDITGTIPFVYQNETLHTWYQVFGDISQPSTLFKTPLIVLHGGPGFTHDYLLSISDLAVDRPVIFYDQVGNGHSTHLDSKPQSFFTIDLYVDELHNLLKHFGLVDFAVPRTFDLLGHSWGGILATEYAVQRQPAGLKKLVLSDSLPSMELWDESQLQLISEFPPDIQADIFGGFSNLTAFEAGEAAFNAVHGCRLVPVPPEVIYSFNQLYSDPTVQIAMSAGVLANWTIIDRLHLIKVPSFVINGQYDIAQDFVVLPFYQNLPKVSGLTIQNASHTPMWEQRAQYMSVVTTFLNS